MAPYLRPAMPRNLIIICLATIALFFRGSFASNTTSASGTKWVAYTEPDGDTVWLRDNRQPSLYTANFGDCAGSSLINVNRFDAAYYRDNMTVMFHLGGSSQLTNQSLMMYISVYAYGEERFNLTFNPCNANIDSLCPLNSSLPIEASGIIPVAPSDVANIPPLALSIPDFEGEAVLRIFANSTESQIACFSAVVTNGVTFSHPAAIGSALGAMTILALVASVSTAIYGQFVSDTRKHYAHSLSLLVVFSVYQHIYFTGALSMNWPSVLVAFWNNFAWAAGMIHSSSVQRSIVNFLGGNLGNISMVGSAQNGVNAPNLGGGFEISQIYKRNILAPMPGRLMHPRAIDDVLARRDLVNSSTGFSWYGSPVQAGLPLPGNFSGFAGTLAAQGIPAATAFMTGLIWFVAFLGLLGASMILLKWILESLFVVGALKTDKLHFFREHWLSFTGAAILRALFIGFFMLTYLTMFQFSFGGTPGALAVAGVVFVLLLVGMLACASYAIFYRVHSESSNAEAGPRTLVEKDSGRTPWYSFNQSSGPKYLDSAKPSSGFSRWRRVKRAEDEGDQPSVHNDENYIRRFGWLTARYRSSKWWFFSFWLIYEFVRACFYGAAIGHPLIQVFGILAVEIIALVVMVLTRPFESNRMNILIIYLLGFSKVATVALSSAFVEQFNQPRILTTVIGIVIIVIQGVLTICLLVAIIVGAVSSYMSITRNKEEFKPRSWAPLRERYFKHIDQKATDRPGPPSVSSDSMPATPAEPYFAVREVRREPKIEDENPNMTDREADAGTTQAQAGGEAEKERPVSRSMSMRSRTSVSNLPYGARMHRTSWSTRDFQNHLTGQEDDPSGMQSRVSLESVRDTSLRHRASSLRSQSRAIPPLPNCPETADGVTQENKMQHRRSTSGAQPLRPKLPRQATTVDEETEGEGSEAITPVSPA